jgi:hypothetical protein
VGVGRGGARGDLAVAHDSVCPRTIPAGLPRRRYLPASALARPPSRHPNTLSRSSRYPSSPGRSEGRFRDRESRQPERAPALDVGERWRQRKYDRLLR